MRIRQVVTVGAGVGLIAALAAACSSKPAAPFPDVATFCTAKAQAECQIASTCLIDPNDCQAQRASLCNTDAVEAMKSGTGTRQYTQANAQACIDAVNAAYGNNNTKVTYAQLVGPGSITDLCERVFSGNAGMSESCQSDYDCTGGFICAPAVPGAAGLADAGVGSYLCEPPVAVAEGQLCSNPGSVCAVDTYCTIPATKLTYDCEPAKADGQPCDVTTEPCVSTERCESNVGVTGNTCMPRVSLGQSCVTSADCDPSAPYCDPYVGNLCTTGLSFASQAADCAAFKSGGAGAAEPPDAAASGG
jgi:hypothetical protein